MRMVGVGYEFLILVILLILVLALLIESKLSSTKYLDEFDIELDEIKNSLNVVAQVLQQIPSLVPSFKIETNPLSQILEFFQSRAQQQEPSIGAEQLRDSATGQYEDGKTQE